MSEEELVEDLTEALNKATSDVKDALKSPHAKQFLNFLKSMLELQSLFDFSKEEAGRLWISRAFKNEDGGFQDFRGYLGAVVFAGKKDKKDNWRPNEKDPIQFRVVYTDGDEEDMPMREVLRFLAPLDTTLQCKLCGQNRIGGGSSNVCSAPDVSSAERAAPKTPAVKGAAAGASAATPQATKASATTRSSPSASQTSSPSAAQSEHGAADRACAEEMSAEEADMVGAEELSFDSAQELGAEGSGAERMEAEGVEAEGPTAQMTEGLRMLELKLSAEKENLTPQALRALLDEGSDIDDCELSDSEICKTAFATGFRCIRLQTLSQSPAEHRRMPLQPWAVVDQLTAFPLSCPTLQPMNRSSTQPAQALNTWPCSPAASPLLNRVEHTRTVELKNDVVDTPSNSEDPPLGCCSTDSTRLGISEMTSAQPLGLPDTRPTLDPPELSATQPFGFSAAEPATEPHSPSAPGTSAYSLLNSSTSPPVDSSANQLQEPTASENPRGPASPPVNQSSPQPPSSAGVEDPGTEEDKMKEDPLPPVCSETQPQSSSAAQPHSPQVTHGDGEGPVPMDVDLAQHSNIPAQPLSPPAAQPWGFVPRSVKLKLIGRAGAAERSPKGPQPGSPSAPKPRSPLDSECLEAKASGHSALSHTSAPSLPPPLRPSAPAPDNLSATQLLSDTHAPRIGVSNAPEELAATGLAGAERLEGCEAGDLRASAGLGDGACESSKDEGMRA